MTEAMDALTRNAESSQSGKPLLRTLVVCDLADSTALVERLGDQQAAVLLRKHDRLARALLEQHGGREIDKTDGFLLLFDRPIEAVAFALDYQRGLKTLSETEGVAMSARVGVHMGDVLVWENTAIDIARGAKPVEVEGLAKPVAARLAALARPRQILLSSVVGAIAHRAAYELGADRTRLQWRKYGTYRVKGMPEALAVIEVGEAGTAPLRAPLSGKTAQKVLPWWRRPWLVAVAAVVVAIALAVGLWPRPVAAPSLAFAARDWVVVGDLQNETGDPRFDSTLDAAFRLGIQQSQYVNVLSELQVRQTLAQMERPADTHVDRAIGAEIGLREHAKALILPTVSNYGRGVRITAELIDPQTQLTVSSQSIDVGNPDDAVGAVDTLVQRLRGTLGESLAQIRTTSTPLAQATTSNLEALRAFSLATEATGRGDVQLALNLLHHALKLDPDFALAYAEIGADYVSMGQRKLAQHAINEALKRSARLSNRERARLQAQKVSSYGTIIEAVQAWKVVADLYPDEPVGSQNVGVFLAANVNDCSQALPYLRRVMSLQHAAQGPSRYTAATCELTLGNFPEALRDFKKAAEGGFAGPFLGLADAYIASDRYDDARNYLDALPQGDSMKVSIAQRRSLIASNQGDLPNAERALRNGLLTLDATQSASRGWYLQLDLVGVLWGQHKLAEALSQTRTDLDVLLNMDETARGHIALDYPTLVAAYSRWAARLGDVALAERGVASVKTAGNVDGYPIRSQLVAVTEAEIALAEGHPMTALHIASVADNNPLWELLDVMARAKAMANQPDAEAAYVRAVNAKGLAFGELYENNLGICTRAIQWNLDRLEAARLSAESNPAQASSLARAFMKQWPLASHASDTWREAESLANAKLSEGSSPN